MRMRSLAVLWVLGVAVAACGESPTETSAGDPTAAPGGKHGLLEPVTRIAFEPIDESSGIVFLAGHYWTHNDSGGSATLFRSETPDFADCVPLAVIGAKAVDWEEIAVLDGDLLVCDTGDNRRKRDDVTLYRVNPVPPTVGGKPALEVRATYPVKYPDGRHDAEGVAVIGGKVHIVVKDRGEGTLVFRFDELVDGRTNVPTLVGTLDLGPKEQVTAADHDPGSHSLVLLTYTQIAAYSTDTLSGRPVHSTWIGARQCEALCVRGDDLLFTNEQRDVYEIEGFRSWSYATLWPPRGSATLSTGDLARIPLRDSAEGAALAWSLNDGRFRVSATVPSPEKVEASAPAEADVGTGVFLTFTREAHRHLDGDDTVLALAVGEDGETADLFVLGFSDRGVAMKSVLGPGVTAEVTKSDDGRLTLEARFPQDLVFDGPVPDRFLFGAFSSETGGPPDALFSGPDFYALYRPYLWGDVTVADD